MAGTTGSPQNTNSRDLDSLLSTSASGLMKRAVAGSSRSVSGSDTNAAAQETGTDIDGATLAVGTASLSAVGYVVDDTSTATVTEGKVGVARMGTDRVAYSREQGPAGTAVSHAINVGTAATSLGTALTSGRLTLDVYNGGTVTVFLGGASVGTATGFPIGTAVYYFHQGSSALYGCTATGTAALRVMERS